MTDGPYRQPRTGLVLTGGGARAAYQAGVLWAIADLLPRTHSNPFPIIWGASAGAINAAALAASAGNFRRGVRRLVCVWRNLRVSEVYRSDLRGVSSSGARWLWALVFGGLAERNPVSLLDNSPLRQLLNRHIDLNSIRQAILDGHLEALSVSATGYTSGESVTFYQGSRALMPWKRARRVGFRSEIRTEHLMASSAIPFVFPAVRINREFFGDGSMRLLAPISPALHLGAERLIIVGSGRVSREARVRVKTEGYPSVAQVAGHALSSIFLDTLEVDLEGLERINRTISLMPQEIRGSSGLTLRHVEYLLFTPSRELESIALDHAHDLPRTVRFFLGGVGAMRRGGGALLSYVLFEKGFCRALLDLGYNDTMRRRDEVLSFFAPHD